MSNYNGVDVDWKDVIKALKKSEKRNPEGTERLDGSWRQGELLCDVSSLQTPDKHGYVVSAHDYRQLDPGGRKAYDRLADDAAKHGLETWTNEGVIEVGYVVRYPDDGDE